MGPPNMLISLVGDPMYSFRFMVNILPSIVMEFLVQTMV